MTTSITSSIVRTGRIATNVLMSGPRDATTTIVFIHGNCSSARFFESTMASLPSTVRAIAPDLRGYGRTERAPIDATRGVRDFSDDVAELLRSPELGITGPVHVVGWSIGGGVAMQLAIDHGDLVANIVLEATMSPFGFGGTLPDGRPCFPDFAGSGGGTANPDFVKRLAAQDTTSEAPTSPRNVMNSFYFKPPFKMDPKTEDMFVSEMFAMAVDDDHYPGDMKTSSNWPGVAPGTRGTNNAISPAYCNLSGFANINPKHGVLWIRGDSDQIVSDTSFFDFGFLGKVGAVPGWPGDEVVPAQPMVSQVRNVLDAYKARGGRYHELVLKDVGHSPHLEAHDQFVDELVRFVAGG